MDLTSVAEPKVVPPDFIVPHTINFASLLTSSHWSAEGNSDASDEFNGDSKSPPGTIASQCSASPALLRLHIAQANSNSDDFVTPLVALRAFRNRLSGAGQSL